MKHVLMMAAALAVPAAATAAGRAQRVRAGALLIENPVIRVASPQSKTGAGFMVIHNRGTRPDRLVAVITDAATRADLHGTIAEGGVMRMRAQAGGVPVPAGGSVRLAPGGLHVMFIGIRQPLPEGAAVAAQLQFERAGTVEVRFTAVSAASHQPDHAH